MGSGGALVGFVGGRAIGSTTETGFTGGCVVGVISGVIVALELFDSLVDGRFRSKVVLIGTSSVNGKVFTEQVCPAVLKDYQSQTYNWSFPDNEESDLYSLDNWPRGLAVKLHLPIPTVSHHTLPWPIR